MVDDITMSNDATLLLAIIWFRSILCVILCWSQFPSVVTELISVGDTFPVEGWDYIALLVGFF